MAWRRARLPGDSGRDACRGRRSELGATERSAPARVAVRAHRAEIAQRCTLHPITERVDAAARSGRRAALSHDGQIAARSRCVAVQIPETEVVAMISSVRDPQALPGPRVDHGQPDTRGLATALCQPVAGPAGCEVGHAMSAIAPRAGALDQVHKNLPQMENLKCGLIDRLFQLYLESI